MNKKRRLLFSVGALLLVLLIAGTMFIIGRGHTVYVDCKAFEYEGKTYTSPYKTVVFVNGNQVAKLYDGERGMSICLGQKFAMTLEITETKGGTEKTTSYTVRLPYNMDGIIISLPALLAGLPEEAYFSEFIIVPTESTDEVIITDELGLPDEDVTAIE